MLPNIRKIFVPDPGYTIFDTDLDSADLRVVVAESGCKEMQAMFDAGLKPYVEIAKEYYQDPTITKHHPKYREFKSFAHGTNYLGRAANLASRLGLLVKEAEQLQRWYFEHFPEIQAWQKRLVEQVNRTSTVSNAFGYRRRFFDRITTSTYNEAVAWIPQSTVGILINHVWKRLDEEVPEIQILMQVHDSLVGQWPNDGQNWKERVLECSKVPVPYDPPLYIPMGIKSSSSSWGECA